MVYLRKTVDAWDIRQYYDGSWETVSCEPTRAEANRAIREYRENQPGIAVKSVKIKEPKEPYLGYDLISALPDFTSEAGVVHTDFGDWVVLAKAKHNGDKTEYEAIEALRKQHKFYKAEIKEIEVLWESGTTAYILLNPFSTAKALDTVENYLGAEVARAYIHEPSQLSDDGVDYLMDSSRGQYLPRGFKDFKISDAWADRADFMLLRDPRHEDYWDVWNDIIDNLEAVDFDGNTWYLHQDGDLFAVCPELMSDERYEEFFGEPRDA